MVELSLNDWVVLALLGEEPRHGFAIARELRPNADLGRVLTIQRALVYRSLDRLVLAGLAVVGVVEPGDSGPDRTVHRVTRRGRTALNEWFGRPVEHVRDLRVEFLVKLRLSQRTGRDTSPLVASQRAVLGPTLDHLTGLTADADAVDRWRHQQATAARAFLEDLTRQP
jgi:DNA-binding PadR family transcriptional regulator